MSVTPIDEGRTDQSAARADATPDTWRERVRAGVLALVRAMPFGGSLLGTQGEAVDPSRSRETPAHDDATPSSAGSVDSLPDRRQPFTSPTRRRSDRNPVELVSQERADTITISHPHNDDASITSDVWEPVER